MITVAAEMFLNNIDTCAKEKCLESFKKLGLTDTMDLRMAHLMAALHYDKIMWQNKWSYSRLKGRTIVYRDAPDSITIEETDNWTEVACTVKDYEYETILYSMRYRIDGAVNNLIEMNTNKKDECVKRLKEMFIPDEIIDIALKIKLR